MAASTEPRSGLKYGWDYFENFKPEMDANLLQIGRVGFHLSVIDRDVSDPTSLTPSAGDTYIVGSAASDVWTDLDDQVVVYDGVDWVAYEPRLGWLAYPTTLLGAGAPR
jgi:hypothetical protein